MKPRNSTPQPVESSSLFVYALLAAFCLYILLSTFASVLYSLIGVAYPAFASIKAIRTPCKEDDTKWLTYWTVFGVFSCFDQFANIIMQWFPLYWLIKILFLLYLYLPQTNGATLIYEQYLDDAVRIVEAYIASTPQIHNAANEPTRTSTTPNRIRHS